MHLFRIFLSFKNNGLQISLLVLLILVVVVLVVLVIV